MADTPATPRDNDDSHNDNERKDTPQEQPSLLLPKDDDDDDLVDLPWLQAIATNDNDLAHALAADAFDFRAVSTPPLPARISNHVYISDATAAHDIPRLLKLGITHVLNVGGWEAQMYTPSVGPEAVYQQNGIVYHQVQADDREGYPMLAHHLDDCRTFIHKAQGGSGRCLVHCAAGINRSGAIVTADYMLTHRCSVVEAVRHCRQKRGPRLLSNTSFQRQLVTLARREGLLGEKPSPP